MSMTQEGKQVGEVGQPSEAPGFEGATPQALAKKLFSRLKPSGDS